MRDNGTDDSESRLRRLPEFMKINGINYPVVFTDDSVAKAYKVPAYPTLYLISREGKIIYSHRGYSPGLKEEIKEVLEKEMGGRGR